MTEVLFSGEYVEESHANLVLEKNQMIRNTSANSEKKQKRKNKKERNSGKNKNVLILNPGTKM